MMRDRTSVPTVLLCLVLWLYVCLKAHRVPLSSASFVESPLPLFSVWSVHLLDQAHNSFTHIDLAAGWFSTTERCFVSNNVARDKPNITIRMWQIGVCSRSHTVWFYSAHLMFIFIHFPFTFPGGGCSGNRLRRSVQTFLSPVIDSCSSWGSTDVPKQTVRYNPGSAPGSLSGGTCLIQHTAKTLALGSSNTSIPQQHGKSLGTDSGAAPWNKNTQIIFQGAKNEPYNYSSHHMVCFSFVWSLTP